MISAVIRPPSIHRTPRRLAQALGVRTMKYPSRDPERNWPVLGLYLTYPTPEERNIEDDGEYESCYHFFSMPKPEQRRQLERADIPVPVTLTERYIAAYWPRGRWIVRPIRHQQGRHYRVTDDPVDFHEGREYISEVFPKEREYRIIYVLGNPLIILRKKPGPDCGPEDAWNHTNGSYFQTLREPGKLHRTDIFEKLQGFPVIQNAQLVGVDVLWRNGEYRVLEFNSCPSLSIDDNLD